MVRIIVDDKIPYIRTALTQMGVEAVYAPGEAIDANMVHDAEALIIRTRTRCNAALLEGSRVKFIATATIGYDHIDTNYCTTKHIAWTNAPGCNASSVCQYVESALLLLQEERGIQLNQSTIGVIGVGHVGSQVAHMATQWGMRVLLNDPPRAKQGEQGFVSLDTIAQEADIITLHTPLTRTGKNATWHLANEQLFQSLKRSPVFINTSRGETCDTDALLKALEKKWVSDAIIDVWENEPTISTPLLERCYIGTPHIAGYSADGKANATRMALRALSRHFNLGTVPPIEALSPEQPEVYAPTRAEALLHIYNVRDDSLRLKANPHLFEQFRGNYPLRREEQAYDIHIKK